jgi:hypothetical protein
MLLTGARLILAGELSSRQTEVNYSVGDCAGHDSSTKLSSKSEIRLYGR